MYTQDWAPGLLMNESGDVLSIPSRSVSYGYGQFRPKRNPPLHLRAHKGEKTLVPIILSLIHLERTVPYLGVIHLGSRFVLIGRALGER